MSTHAIPFAELLEMIDRLPLDQRESLVEVLRRRNSEDERNRIVASSRAAKKEHRAGKTRPTTPEELMREILG
jgi:hypothetical protein